MIKIAICDDDSFMVKDIKSRTEAYFKETCVECKITTFDDGQPLVQTYKSCDKPFDIIILDMKLKRMNGDDASKMIRCLDQDVILIFISSWISYAVFGYEVNAHRFIPKDGEKSNDDLTGALESAYQLMQSRKQYMLIHQHNGIVRIELREILYIEALNKNLMVHLLPQVYFLLPRSRPLPRGRKRPLPLSQKRLLLPQRRSRLQRSLKQRLTRGRKRPLPLSQKRPLPPRSPKPPLLPQEARQEVLLLLPEAPLLP